MDPVHDKGVHGPGPRRGSMDQGSMFCTLPVVRVGNYNCSRITVVFTAGHHTVAS